MKVPRQKDEEGQSRAPRQFRCPACKRVVRVTEQDASQQLKFFPFCSERCKLIDLGAWLDAEYRIPSRPDEDSEGLPDHGSASAEDPM
jgi:endogenous inhibitor of DNA gyrase (YacG/DUF329 family)